MEVLLKANVRYKGQRFPAGTYADIPDAEALIANGYAEAVKANAVDTPPLEIKAKEGAPAKTAAKPKAKKAAKSKARKAGAK